MRILSKGFFYFLFLIILGSCSTTPSTPELMANLQGTWQGRAVPNDSYAGTSFSNVRTSSFKHDKYADSLLMYYYQDSTMRDLKLRFKDSTCWIDGLNFYHHRLFSIVSFDAVDEGKNLLILQTPSTEQDSILITKLFYEAPEKNESDSLGTTGADSTRMDVRFTSEYDWSFGKGPIENAYIQAPNQALMFQNIQLDGDKMTFLVHSQHSTVSAKVEFTRVK